MHIRIPVKKTETILRCWFVRPVHLRSLTCGITVTRAANRLTEKISKCLRVFAESPQLPLFALRC